MKSILALIFTALTLNVEAYEMSFIGPCSDIPLLAVQRTYGPGLNVGGETIELLQSKGIPFEGSILGLSRVFNSPNGLDAMEVISDNEMMAYGWCFEIDGLIPEVYANEVEIRPETQKIVWFYGYAHYVNGQWISQCEKSFERKSPQFCK